METAFREYTRGDIIHVAKLFRLAWHRDSLPDFLIEEKIHGEEDYDPALATTVFSGETLCAFGMGVVKPRPEGKMGYIKLFCVHPVYQRKGIGRELLKNIEEKIRRRGAKAIRLFESYPNYLCPGIDPFYTSAVSFFERSGYKKIGDTSNLTANLLNQDFDTSADETRLLAAGITCRRATKEDYNPLQNWIEAYFPAWRGEIDGAYKNDPATVFIAIKDGEIFAFSAYEGNNYGTGWFGPMGTQPGIRGGGVGSVLLKLCLRSMKETGFVKAVIPWVGPIPFYQQHVFAQVDRIFWRYEKRWE